MVRLTGNYPTWYVRIDCRLLRRRSFIWRTAYGTPYHTLRTRKQSVSLTGRVFEVPITTYSYTSPTDYTVSVSLPSSIISSPYQDNPWSGNVLSSTLLTSFVVNYCNKLGWCSVIGGRNASETVSVVRYKYWLRLFVLSYGRQTQFSDTHRYINK